MQFARDYYLEAARDWVDPFDRPVVEIFDHGDYKFRVVREDLLGVGSKARTASILFQLAWTDNSKPIVYVAPRFGFAAISLAYLARKYGRRLVLFMPACREISDHQAIAIEMGAEVIFERIAAMPNLNRMAAHWAHIKGGYFVPLGLRHELVTAAIVRTAVELVQGYEAPTECWTAISTGVLSRALQIAWPETTFRGVCVSRNIKDGERGQAELISYPRAFGQNALVTPPFPCASNYDAKCWEVMTTGDNQAIDGAWFWNVAGNIEPPIWDRSSIKSNVDWKY